MNKTKEKPIIISDLLSFTSCKLKLFSKSKLLNVIKSFYSKNEAKESLKTLIKAIPSELFNIRIERILKQSNDPFILIINLLKCMSAKDWSPLFGCKNLNNIPKLDGEEKSKKAVSRTTIFQEHRKIESQLNEVFDALFDLKNKFLVISENNSLNSDLHAVQSSESLKTKVKSSQKQPDNDDILAEDTKSDEVGVHLILNRHVRSPIRKEESKSRVPNLSRTRSVDLNEVETCSASMVEVVGGGEEEVDPPSTPLKRSSRGSYAKNRNYYLVRRSTNPAVLPSSPLPAIPSPSSPLPAVPLSPSSRSDKVYTCSVCSASFSAFRSYKTHTLSHFESDYKCPLCADRFKEEDWLGHVRGCPGIPGFPSREDVYCPDCDAFFANKILLGYHKAYHNPSRFFECLECKFRFYTQKAVKEHFRTHASKYYKFKCPFCYFRAPGEKKMREHIRCHTGDKPYKCQLCHHSASTVNNLKCHMRRHRLTKEFQCNLCDKSFKAQAKLNTHQRVHANAKQYKCPVCGRGFNYGVYMSLHHKRHFDRKTRDCPECPFKGGSDTAIRKHVATHIDTTLFK